LRYASFDGVKALERAILAFTKNWNDVMVTIRVAYTGKVLNA